MIGVTGRGERASEEIVPSGDRAIVPLEISDVGNEGKTLWCTKDCDLTVAVSEFVFAGVGEGAAAGAAILEIRALLVHFAEFLPHEANYFQAEHGLSTNEFEEGGGGDEAEAAVGFAMGAEIVRGGAEGCGESDDATGAEEALEDFATVVGEDGDSREAVLNDVDAAALSTLADDGVVAEKTEGLGERVESLQKFR